MYIALTTYDRMEFLKPSLESLIQTDFPPDSHLILSDDKSDPKVQDYIRSMFEKEIKNLSVKLIFNKTNIGCDMNMIRVIRDCFYSCNDQFVITIDSDALYNPNWVHKLLWAKEQINEKVGMLGVFNTLSHTVTGDYNENIVRKRSLGGFAVMLNRDIFMHPLLAFISWDWSCVSLCNKLGYGMFCTKKSYVEHIGTTGAHSMGNSVDRAQNFVQKGD